MRARHLALLALVSCSEDLSLPPVPVVIPPGGGCLTDSDCAQGICDVNHVCQANGCRTNAQCQWGLCTASNVCNSSLCQTNANCQTGTCDVAAGICFAGGCSTDTQCDGGSVCDNGICEVGCHNDSQCPGCQTCSSGGGSFGQCTGGPGPPILGNRMALKMTDNLVSAVNYARQQVPGAQLMSIGGYALNSSGTTDVTADYVAEWLYYFLPPDGGTQPISVAYRKLSGAKCGTVDFNAPGSAEPTIPDSAWTHFLDATQLVPAFEAMTNCQPLQVTNLDLALYSNPSGTVEVEIHNKANQFWLVDPTRLDGGFLSCP
jgi:hypothetical protein